MEFNIFILALMSYNFMILLMAGFYADNIPKPEPPLL